MRNYQRDKNIITVKAMKRNQFMLLTDYGRTIPIQQDQYTSNILLAEWRFWILKKQLTNYIVIKSIPYGK